MNEFICPQCQATLKEGAKFCHVCGYKVPEEQAQNEAPKAAKEEQIDMHTFTDVKSDEVLSAIKSGNIFKRAISIMFKPKSEWEVVAKETPNIPMLILGYVLIFSLIPVFFIIVGNGLIGKYITFSLGNNFVWGFLQAFVFIAASFTAIIVGAVIINMLAPAFKTEKNLGRAMQLTAYSFTPMFFAGILFILPFLSFLVYLAGLYGIFILLMGLPILLKTPKNTQIGYFFTSIGLLYGIFFIVYGIFYAIFWTIFNVIFYSAIFY